MGYRINHIHLKSPDPRKTAEWYVTAFDFQIASDETRVFGDRFLRCKSADGGINVNISGARTNEKLGPGNAFLRFPQDSDLRPVVTGWFSEFRDLSRSRAGGRVA